VTSGAGRRALLFAAPYVAVLAGIYGLRSGWAALALYHVAILAALGRDRREALRSIAKGWSSPAGWPLTAACAATGLLFRALWTTAAIEPAALSESLRSIGLSGASWIAFCAYYAIVNPALEEMYWRGLLAQPRTAPGAADVAFAGYHALVLPLFLKPLWILAAVVVLVAVAWIWRRLAARHGGLAIPVVSHAAADVSTIAFALALLM